MISAFLALGSNLGAREHYLKKAVESLGLHGIEVVRAASIYETEPKDVVDQPWFLNTVVQINTILSPHRLLELCLAIEQENLRQRFESGAARTLDIDIIFYDDRVFAEPGLTIPHPRYSERRFVLEPLAEIAPTHLDPITGVTVAELLSGCKDTSEVRRLQKIS